MKASIRFRDERKPLLRAKVPLNIMSFPFQSAITAGESKDLSLNLSTFFDSGPSLKFSYRPNDSQNPFSFIFKTGIGHFGSPTKSPLTMSAEFNLIGNQNPSFFIHFKPDFGDFSLKKSHSSEFVKGLGDKSNGNVINGDDFLNNGYFKGAALFQSSLESKTAAGVVDGLLRGTQVSARTSLPVKDFALVNFRWGLRLSKCEAAAEDLDAVIVGQRGGRNTGIGMPLLVMNKLGIEHITKSKQEDQKTGPGLKYAEVADACFQVKKQLELIQAENGLLSKAFNDLRTDIASGNMEFSLSDRNKYSGGDRRANSDNKSSEMKGFGSKAPAGDVKDELKALKGA